MPDVQTANRDINALEPTFKKMVQDALPKLVFGHWIGFITEGFRTLERQNYLYAQGRTLPGKIVTYQKDGESQHTKGLAIDIAFKHKLNQSISYDTKLFQMAAEVMKPLGFLWGGDWKNFTDMPHFYIEHPLPTNETFINKWKGYLILDVEEMGKLYYISPKTGERFHLDFSNLDEARKVANKLAVGFKHNDVLKIPPGII